MSGDGVQNIDDSPGWQGSHGDEADANVGLAGVDAGDRRDGGVVLRTAERDLLVPLRALAVVTLDR